MKKCNAVLGAVLAVTLIAGCGNGNNAGQNENASNADGKAKGATKISLFATLHTPEVPSDKIEKLLEEKTNTELDIQWIPANSYDDKVNAAFATDALPMVVGTGKVEMFREAIRDGQFWEIGPYLKDYPNLSNLNPDVLKNTMVDGKLYSLYMERPLSRAGLIYRKDWAEKLGIAAPTTIDELYDMLYQFKHNDPDGNGEDDTIGLTDRSDMIYGAFKAVSSWFGTPNYWGEKDGQLLPEFMFPEYVETMKFFRKLHEEGLINQDFPVTSKEDQRNLLITGRAGAYIGSMPDAMGLQDKLDDINPDGVLDVQNRIEGPNGLGIWAIPGYGSVWLFPKSSIKTEEQLKDILAFYDQMMSTEIANLIHWGIEGEHYTLDNGTVVQNKDLKLIDREVKPYAGLVVGGEQSIPGLLKAKWDLPVKQRAEELVVDNNNFLIHDPTAPLESKTNIELGPRLQQSINDATFQFILGDIDEEGFQKVVDKWLSDGGQKIIDEFNASYELTK
ncbi:extracellular solute-binding protein [Marinicrinis lubricantis]|uniref:Extracellular solute-binding protein n=1 Tax=Marinicrinis lubricantis TaxID=2086470 RepID=A0ABW1IWE7_9BACL